MTIITPTYESISIGALHNICNKEYNTIIIQVGRRNEPGAGKYAGMLLLTANEPIARFKDKEAALEFIDELQLNGLIEAMDEVTRQKNVEQHVKTLQPTTETVDPDEFIQQAGITDPLNLFINPQLEIEKELTEVTNNPVTNTSNTEV